MPRPRLKVKTFEPLLDRDEFVKLYRLLYAASNGNDSACARMCGITRPTWCRWQVHPPKMPHWPLVLRHIIIELLGTMKGRRGSKTNAIKTRITDQLAKIPTHKSIEDAVLSHYTQYSPAEDHLRRLLSIKGMYWDQIRKPAYAGGHTHRALHRAAKSLGIIKTVTGFGEDRRSFWRLDTFDAQTLNDPSFDEQTYDKPLDED